MTRNKKNEALITIIFILIIIALDYIYFYNVIGTDACLGDVSDGRLTALISEHWYQFFMGRDSITEVGGMFYPAENILSYSDVLLGVGLIQSVFRFLGFGVFSAYKYSLIIIHLAGSIGLFCYLFNIKRINVSASILGVICFSYSNALFVQSINTQLIVASALVFELIFLHYFIHSNSRKVKYSCLVLAAIYMALQFYTAYYVAFMGALQFAVFVIVYCVVIFVKDREYFRTLLKRWKEYLIGILVFVVAMIPFVMLYLPTFNGKGGISYEDIYVTHLSNLFYNGFDKSYDSLISSINENYEVVNNSSLFPIVSSILMLIITCICFFMIIKEQKTERKTKKIAIVSLLIANIIIFALGISIKGFSLWKIIYSIVPGAKVIRAQWRWELIMLLPVSILIAFCADYAYNYFCGKVKHIWIALMIIVSVIVWYDNFNPGGAISAYNEGDSEAFIQYVEKPPQDCKAFYIKNGQVDVGNIYILEANPLIPYSGKIDTDALYLSTYYNLKTSNGYSGGKPPHWDISGVEGDDTDSQAIQWLRTNEISPEGIYSYDMKNNRWEKVEY